MKIITKTFLLTIIIIFFPLESFAHVEHYEKVEKFLMEIFKDGKKIGFNNYTFKRNKKNLEIDIGKKVLQETVESLFKELNIKTLDRKWLSIVASKS